MPREVARFVDGFAQADAGRSPRPAARRASAQDRPPAAGSRPLPSPRTIAARRSSRSVGSIAGGTARLVDPVERAADPLVELGIADRDQARQQQAAAACPNERFGHRPHRAIVRQQDAPLRQAQRILAEPRDQPRGKRVGERAMGRNGEDGDPLRRQAFSSAASVIGIDCGVPTSNHRPWCTAPKRAPPRSPGPTGCWSRTALPARRGAAASKPSGCR